MCIFASYFVLFFFNLFFVNLFFLAFVRVGHRLGKFFTHVIKKNTHTHTQVYKTRQQVLCKLFKGLWNSLTRRSGVAFLF